MIQEYHGLPEEEASAGERLEAAGRTVGIVVGAVLMVGGLFLCCSIFYTILNVVKDPAALAASQQQWQMLLGTEPLIFETPGGTVDAGPILALGIMGVAAMVLVHIAIQMMLAGGRILPLVMGERKAIKTMLRESLAQQQRAQAEATADDGAAKPPRLKF